MLGSDVTTEITDSEIIESFKGRPLSVLVTHRQSKELLSGLLAEAERLGISVTAFFMDEGIDLLADQQWVASLPEGRYAACDVSARSRGVEPPQRIVAGGQYQNATMVHDAAHVVSL